MVKELRWQHPFTYRLRVLAVDVLVEDAVIEKHTVGNHVGELATQIDLEQCAEVSLLRLVQLVPAESPRVLPVIQLVVRRSKDSGCPHTVWVDL